MAGPEHSGSTKSAGEIAAIPASPCLEVHGCSSSGPEGPTSTCTKFKADVGQSVCLADSVWQDLRVCPRTCPSSGAQLCTYLRWFARPACLPHKTSVLRLRLGLRRLRLFLRSRMGCHDLPSDAGRRQGVPRLQRVCPQCSLGEVGHERPLVFTCAALEHIRSRYRHLFGPRTFTMVQFLWQEDMVSVARPVTDCFEFLRSAGSPSNQP